MAREGKAEEKAKGVKPRVMTRLKAEKYLRSQLCLPPYWNKGE
jgi:hypothetical protein